MMLKARNWSAFSFQSVIIHLMLTSLSESRAYISCWMVGVMATWSVDETAYTLDTYSGHSLDICNISIDFPTHFRSIFDDLDILWFISTSRRTSNITF